MPKTEFRQYIDANAALPADCVLGHIVWFSVSDGSFDAAHMEREFSRLMLNPTFLPRAINPADAWEKATKEAQGRKYDVLIGGVTYPAELMVREVERTPNQIHRHLIREVKDSKHRKLLYGPVGEFVFYRPSARNGVVDHSTANHRATPHQDLSLSERPVIEGVIDDVSAAYKRYANFHDGQRVRSIIRNYLLHLNGIQMKTSVYFVHATRADELQRLQEFANGLDGCSLTMLPLPDLPSLRQEVIDAFQREAVDAFTQVVTDIQKLRETRRGKLRPEALAKHREQYADVMRLANEYGRTLQLSQDHTAAAAELARDALLQLQADVLRDN